MNTSRHIPSHVPSDIADLNQWVLWLYDSENRKIPYQVDGKKAASNDPHTWTDIDTAIEIAKSHERLAGVGFVFHESDPFCGIDLDDCLIDGKAKPWAEEIIRRFGETYGEVSPSGTGLKFWVRASIESAKKFPYADGAIEIYSSGRYFTFTGNRWPTATMDIVDCQATVDWLLTLHPDHRKGPFKLPAEIKKKTQHNTLISYAAQLWAKNLDPDEVIQLTIAASKRCQEVPPEKNAEAIARWIIEHRRRGRSEELKAKLNGGSPTDYAFEEFTSESPTSEENLQEPTPTDDKPEEIEASVEYKKWPHPLGEAAYHGIIGEIAREIEPHSEADPAAILIQALVMVGSVFDRSVYWIAESTNHYCNEFVAIVGATASGRKGSSFNQIKSLMKIIQPDWVRNRIVGGMSSGEGLIFNVRDEVIEEKTKKGVTALEVTDSGEKDKRLLVVEEELSGAIQTMSREGNTLSQVIRQAWDSPDTLAPMTKNNRIKATNPHISVIGHITRDELLKSLKQVQNTNGFANRYLWFCAKKSKSLPFGGSPDRQRMADLAQKLDYAIGMTSHRLINFDSEASEMWEIVYDQLNSLPAGQVGAILSRGTAHVRRIATIYAALDCSPVVTCDHLEAALEIWRYSRDSVEWIFSTFCGDDNATKIYKAIDAHKTGITRTELSAALGRNMPKKVMEIYLGELLSSCRITERDEKRGRKTVKLYCPVDA